MPARTTPLVNGEFYHIFNRGINKQPIFLGIRDHQRALDLLEFYSSKIPTLRFSKFLLLPEKEKISFVEKLRKENKKLIDLICFCFMPNHFHFLIQQKEENGISKFMSIFQNSYTKYFNIKHKKSGPILQGQFKAVRVEDQNQLLHLSRYIHLNPYTSFVVKELVGLENYPWSSFPEYSRKVNKGRCNKEFILSDFKDKEDYKNFVLNHAEYQRELDKIKHLVLES